MCAAIAVLSGRRPTTRTGTAATGACSVTENRTSSGAASTSGSMRPRADSLRAQLRLNSNAALHPLHDCEHLRGANLVERPQHGSRHVPLNKSTREEVPVIVEKHNAGRSRDESPRGDANRGADNEITMSMVFTSILKLISHDRVRGVTVYWLSAFELTVSLVSLAISCRMSARTCSAACCSSVMARSLGAGYPGSDGGGSGASRLGS